MLAPWGERLWASCRLIEPGTVAAGYLGGRRCALPPPEGDLRWHPNLDDKVSGYRGPALVALVTDVNTGEPVNLHRTWFAQDGAGKAEIDKPRRVLKGHRSRGVIRLWPDTEVTIGLAIGEGIETCLAAANEGLTPLWATISASNLAAFPILPGSERITILCDHDKPNPKTGKRAGHEAAFAVIERYTAAGLDPDRYITVILPPLEGQDVNDLVRDYRRAG
jgi:putative DNA primase/helicase